MATTRRNGLTGEQKRFVCRLFAEYCTPVEIQNAVREHFGFTLALPSVIYYRDCPKWQSVILEMRVALIRNLADLPISSKYWRLKKIHELFDTENRYRVVRYSGKSEIPIEEKPVGELRQLLQLAAEELGELRQVHEFSGKSGGPLEYRAVFSDGSAVPAATVPLPEKPPGGSGS